MKKLVFLIACTFIFTACEIEDDGPTRQAVYVEVENIELPASFEKGKTYEIEVSYLLPNACHLDEGLRVQRGGHSGEEYRDIYVFAIASHDIMQTECNKEDENLKKTREFSITIDDEAPFTFYLWTGVDEEDKPIFTEIEVPVGTLDNGTPEGDGNKLEK